MKVKMDFVSNSSSTSFVYISREMLTEQNFLKAAGIATDSPLAGFFSEMYHELHASISGGNRLRSVRDVESLDDRHSFTPEVLEKMKQAIEEGKLVITSTLRSEAALVESILCTEIFQIESEEFFINGYDNYW
jgi:hypothetical protein